MVNWWSGYGYGEGVSTGCQDGVTIRGCQDVVTIRGGKSRYIEASSLLFISNKTHRPPPLLDAPRQMTTKPTTKCTIHSSLTIRIRAFILLLVGLVGGGWETAGRRLGGDAAMLGCWRTDQLDLLDDCCCELVKQFAARLPLIWNRNGAKQRLQVEVKSNQVMVGESLVPSLVPSFTPYPSQLPNQWWYEKNSTSDHLPMPRGKKDIRVSGRLFLSVRL